MDEYENKETEEGRALKIAAKIMQETGLCRYKSATYCRRIFVNESICAECIRTWLLRKARTELRKEEAKRRETDNA